MRWWREIPREVGQARRGVPGWRLRLQNGSGKLADEIRDGMQSSEETVVVPGVAATEREAVARLV